MSLLVTCHAGREFVAVPADGGMTDHMSEVLYVSFAEAIADAEAMTLPDDARLLRALMIGYEQTILSARADAVAAHAIGVAKHGEMKGAV